MKSICCLSLALIAAAHEQDASAPIYAFPRVANEPSNVWVLAP